jgi:pyruvate/2-oxoacid:ferredoxin oxidoreductase alpha subunit
MRDVIVEAAKQGIQVTYLHYDYVWPLDRDSFLEFAKNHPNIYAIEGNATGQLASMLDPENAILKGKFLKYDGRRFYLEEVLGYIINKVKVPVILRNIGERT